MKNKWIKCGDKVIVIAGNDRGVIGQVIARTESKILVQGVNFRKRHVKSREQNRKSDIVEMERPVHISNVALCDAHGNRLKLKVSQGKDGKRELTHLLEGEEKSYRVLKKEAKREEARGTN